MRPSELRKTKAEYMEFPREVFAKRVHAEITKQKADGFWVHGRNKQSMKQHVKRGNV
jgi:hypothetical protein